MSISFTRIERQKGSLVIVPDMSFVMCQEIFSAGSRQEAGISKLVLIR